MKMKAYVELSDVNVEWDQDEGITAVWVERDGKEHDLFDILTKGEMSQLETQTEEWMAVEAERIQCAREDAADARREEMLIRRMEK
jgi:hypothetical protein